MRHQFILTLLSLVLGMSANAQICSYTRLGQPDGASYQSHVMFDIDRDGRKDFIVARGQTLNVYRADSVGYDYGYRPISEFVTDVPPVNLGVSRKLTLVDLDGNGDPEMLYHAHTIGLMHTRPPAPGESLYGLETLIPQTSLPASTFQVLAADLNGDGRQDIVVASATVYIFTQQANGTFVRSDLTTGFNASGFIVSGDVDNDGDIDLIATMAASAAVRLFRNNGTGTFISEIIIPSLAVNGRVFSGTNSNMLLKDADGDGWKDLLISSGTGCWVSLYKNTGTSFVETTIRPRLVGSGGVHSTLTDFDGDGDLDIVSGRPVAPAGLTWFENLGNGSYSTEKELLYERYYNSGTGSIQLSGVSDDFDGDGKIDYMFGHVGLMLMYNSSFPVSHATQVLAPYGPYMMGKTTDIVTVTLTSPFKPHMEWWGAIDYDVMMYGNGTDSLTATGELAKVNAMMYQIYYYGMYRGRQYFDVKYTNASGAVFNHRVPIYLTDGELFTLPVELLTFRAKSLPQAVELKWTTATESATSHFEVERATGSSTNFTSLGMVEAKGNSTAEVAYAFVDNAPVKGINRYRLKIVDIDRKFTHSKVVTVNREEAITLNIYPIPATNEITLMSKTPLQSIEIFDQNGRLVKRVAVERNSEVKIDISALKAGQYYVKSAGITGKFIKK